MKKHFTLTREELLENGFVNLGDVRLEWDRDIYDDTYDFTLTLPDAKPSAKSGGVAECYGCGREFKWSVTPGSIPTCDQCMRWICE